MKEDEVLDDYWGFYPLGRHAHVTIPVNRLDPTYYLQATSSFQSCIIDELEWMLF